MVIFNNIVAKAITQCAQCGSQTCVTTANFTGDHPVAVEQAFQIEAINRPHKSEMTGDDNIAIKPLKPIFGHQLDNRLVNRINIAVSFGHEAVGRKFCVAFPDQTVNAQVNGPMQLIDRLWRIVTITKFADLSPLIVNRALLAIRA